VTCDLARHADIVREQHDTAIGLQRENTNIPTAMAAGVRHKLTKLSDQLE
jgi:hypothetical protein